MSQGDVKYVRQLPKDKIYRNIFEAEVRKSVIEIWRSGRSALNPCLVYVLLAGKCF